MSYHPLKAKEFIEKSNKVQWHDEALWFVRQKRDTASKAIDEWESLRNQASKIKQHTMENLYGYLVEFEKNATQNGIQVHFANDAKEHNQIVESILKQHNAIKIVKSKSMLTEECGLNHYLETKGFEVVDTDLGERIIQLNNEPPSHIVLPAIHLKKEEVSDIFHKHLHTQQGNYDPTYLTHEARKHLREKFENAHAAITGVNFAVASTGGFVVCTNEGNADMGTSLSDLHIACMGVEKLIPNLEALGVFTRVLARSATGQNITTYTSHFHKPQSNKQIHLIIVDNGRSEILQKQNFKQALSCIRCGACMNTCPVYRRSGGHSYGYTIPGPIGSVLGALKDPQKNSSLPFASTLCGSCDSVCPVKINLHELLLELRDETKEFNFSKTKLLALKLSRVFLSSKFLYKFGFGLFRRYHGFIEKLIPQNGWTDSRTLPKPAKKSFKELYKQMEK
ncbi:MAG: lactate utilization protein [Campylobacterales bacterium]|nr:lactate utilization protein [Campylobacterales bacterium]